MSVRGVTMEIGRGFERERHQDAIRHLAESLGKPLAVVQEVYERELELLAPEVKVKDYLTVLVSRRVKDRILREV